MSEHKEPKAVFYDPNHHRWKKVKVFLLGFGGLGMALLFGLTVAVLSTPRLPQLELSRVHRIIGQHLEAIPPEANLHESTQLPSRNLKPVLASQAPSRAVSRVIGFYVNWDDNSFTSLKQNAQNIDVLMPEWLHLTPDGLIVKDNLFKQEKARFYLRDHNKAAKIDVLINNYNSKTQNWDSSALRAALRTPSSRQALIAALLEYIKTFDLNGVNIDFENIPDDLQNNLVLFMQTLYARFHALGLEVTESVPLDDPAFDYPALAAANDQLVLMGYDQHEDTSEAGAVAGQPWLMQNVADRISQIGEQKIILALGNYGYDWTLGGSQPVNELAFQEAQMLARDSDAKIGFGGSDLNPTFTYDDEHGKKHAVWYLDAASVFDQVKGSQNLGVSSFALWRMGQEDPSVWKVFTDRTHLDEHAANDLAHLRYGYDLDYQGQGELLKVTSLPKDGVRQVNYNAKNGLITGETTLSYAAPYQITRWGGSDPKKLVLTFDDGPDPTYTPQVLDILEREHVPAAFFVIGSNAQAMPELMKRMVRDGFEIGNHTFTHPNLTAVSPEQFKLELNATQRLLESELGISTLLFRPPYAEDVEPETPDQAASLVQAGQLGYYTVGMQIDLLDWHANDPKQILHSVLEDAQNHVGNVILLHDAGGDRHATIAALPTLIHELKARGFELVSLSNLLGVSTHKLNPAVVPQALNEVSGVGFQTLEWLGSLLGWLFVAGIAMSVARLLWIALLAILEARRYVKNQPLLEHVPTLSVIVPAFNEEKVVAQTIHSLLASDVVTEILVMDDGSTDQTATVVRQAFDHEPRVKLFTLQNGGKSRALNVGLSHATGEVVLLLDADTILKPDAPRQLLQHFADPRVAAVAGNAKVGNRINLLTRWQALEYITAQNLERRALAYLGCITVVPGAIGAWRHELILERGGFMTDTLAEDADLTMRLLRDGYRISYEPKAIALTEAPDTVQGFLKQRFRWMFGTLQAAYKQRDTVFQPRHKGLGLFALPNVLIFQIFFPFISSMMDLALIAQLLWVFSQLQAHPSANPLGAFSHGVIFYALFIAVDMLAAVVAFALEKNEDWSLLFWLIPQRFFYRQLMYFVAIKAAIAALRGRPVGWGKLERKASVVSS